MKSQRHALADRGHDLYETHPVAVRALLAAEWLPNSIWEPAVGRGAIADVLRSTGRTVIGTDIVDRGYAGQSETLDFLQAGAPLADCIVTNPPFKDAAAFVEHALALCPRVILLLRLAFLESERRRSILDSGSLARVHVFRDRLPMMHRDGWAGPKATSQTAYAWFVWDRSHRGAPSLHRLSWREHAQDSDQSLMAAE